MIAIVPTFNPDARLHEVLRSLRPQVDSIVVVDDGSHRPSDDLPQGQVEQIRLRSNGGIAAALNIGVRRALELGADYILTVDQDSVVGEGYVENAVSVFRGDLTNDLAGVGAWAREPGSGPLDASANLVESRGVLQSGLLMPAPVVRRLGRYRESLFIDCVETEYILRARRQGLRTVVSRDCQLDHRLGVEREGALLGRRFRFPMHNPTRRYYIVRNRLWLTVKYGAWQPVWTFRQWKDVLRVLLLTLGVPGSTRPHLIAAVLGCIDFVRGRSGEMPHAYAKLLTSGRSITSAG